MLVGREIVIAVPGRGSIFAVSSTAGSTSIGISATAAAAAAAVTATVIGHVDWLMMLVVSVRLNCCC